MEAKVQRAMAQVRQAQQEAWAAKQEAALLRDELSRVLPSMSPTHAPSHHDASLLTSPMVYATDAEFAALRAEGLSARVDCLASLPEQVVQARFAEVSRRGLTDFEIECSLRRRKECVEEKYTCEGLSSEAFEAKVRSRVLQLLRVYHRQRLAVLQGHKLPPLGSLFAQLPQ
jgi:hypothetical protein